MKKALILFSLFLTLGLGSGKAEAYPIFYPYVNNAWIGGYYGGWGYYPWYGAPYYPIYGYSYWSAFNYAPYYASFGAISISKSKGNFGVSWVSNTRANAISSANAYCGQEDCAPVVWVQGGCAAVARSEGGKNLGWGYYTTKYQAISYAMQSCKRSGDEGCKLAAWVCSY